MVKIEGDDGGAYARFLALMEREAAKNPSRNERVALFIGVAVEATLQAGKLLGRKDADRLITEAVTFYYDEDAKAKRRRRR
jgi:hypothetical protein